MRLSVEQRIANWQSLFITSFIANCEKNKVPLDRQVKILLSRITELEKKNLTLKKMLKEQARYVHQVKQPKSKDTFYVYETSEKFFRSKKWKELRYRFLVKSERFCVLCGTTINLQVDHIVPRSISPELELDESNLQILCLECNFGKSNKDVKKIVLRKKQAASLKTTDKKIDA